MAEDLAYSRQYAYQQNSNQVLQADSESYRQPDERTGEVDLLTGKISYRMGDRAQKATPQKGKKKAAKRGSDEAENGFTQSKKKRRGGDEPVSGRDNVLFATAGGLMSTKSNILCENSGFEASTYKPENLSSLANLTPVELEWLRDLGEEKWIAGSCHEAARAGDLEAVRSLVEGGADVDGVDKNEVTPLMYAAREGALEVVLYLLEHGADKEAKSNGGFTALMWAARYGNVDVVRILLEQGADKETKDSAGKTALILAAESGHVDVVRCLMDRGADKESTDNDGSTALILATVYEKWDVVRYLLDRGVDKEAKSKYGFTALIWAAFGGHVNVVRYLLDQGANKEAKDNDGSTALVVAARNGCVSVVRCLVEQGADIEAKSNDAKTVLMLASQGGLMNVVQFLLDRGADVNAVDTNGRTALHFAAKAGHADIQRLLASRLHVTSSASHSSLDVLEDHKSPLSTKWLITPFEVSLQMQMNQEDAGVQFRAKWLDADVVVKLFIPGASMASFAEEVKVWRQLRHPNVIKLYGACSVGHYFFVSEFASKGSLVEYLAACRRAGGEWTPWRFLHEAALGLAYLHERRLVHGNLRGSNILIGSDGLAKLSEFSLSGSAGGSGVFGSTRWQSPERVRGGEVSFASDVYSLGLCIVEALSGETPWKGKSDQDVIHWKKDWNPALHARSRDAPGPLSDDVVDLVSRMCALDPTRRVTASAAARMLERLATKEQSERQAKQQPEPEPNLSIDEYDKDKDGRLTELWSRIQSEVPTCTGNDLHRSMFEEVQAMYEQLSESAQPRKLLDQFRQLLVDMEAMMRPDSLQNRIQRLSATRATGFALAGLRHRLDGIWSMLRGSPSEFEVYKQRWREQQPDHPELFISEEDHTLLVLKEPKAEEDWRSLRTLLRSEIDDHRDDYSPGQLSVIQEAYDDLVEHSRSGVVTTTPEWFLPLYELDVDKMSCVGAGGFGGVYRARWLDSEVVVKLLDQGDWSRQANGDFVSTPYSTLSAPSIPPVTSVDRKKKKQRRHMFEHEVNVWFGLSHPYIVRLFGACHIGTLFFACEYASQGSLDKYLREHPDELWQKLHEAALGVQYLHARGVVHGDLKCNNILVGGDGKAKVTDFGLSSDSAELDKTEAQVSAASHWVAPECLEHGASKLSEASDVYSLGMCVVEALRVVEMVSLNIDQQARCPYPWGKLQPLEVRYHVVRSKKLPPRPQISTDDEWRLVERMCRNDLSERLKISTAVDELERLASAKASVRTELTSQREQIPAVIESMQACTRSTEDGGPNTLSQIFGLLWDRMAHLLSVISGGGGDLESLRELVDRAKESTTTLPEVKDTLVEFTEAAMRGYALHRDLDKLMDAKFWRADTDGREVHEWQRRCNEFLGVVEGSGSPRVSSEIPFQDVRADRSV